MTLSRRQFMRRGLLVAAGGLLVPDWAQKLGEEMQRLQPQKQVWVHPSGGTVAIDFETDIVNHYFKQAEWHDLQTEAALVAGASMLGLYTSILSGVAKYFVHDEYVVAPPAK